MFLNHSQDFAQFQPTDIAANPPALSFPKRAEISALKDGTMLETPTGWKPVETLQKGDQVYTLDGGFDIIYLEKNDKEGKKYMLKLQPLQ